MVQREYHSTREDGVRLFRSYSDKGVLIRKRSTTQDYKEAIDVEHAPFRYEETNIPIEASHSAHVQNSIENSASSDYVQS